MGKKRADSLPVVQPYRYRSPNIPMSAIRRFARQIAERFHPDKIILFGSYAYGQPHEESDVDLLVIMPTRNVIDQAIRIQLAFDRLFSLDVHVRTPYQMKIGLKEDDRDWFLYEIVEKGEVLYEAPNCKVGGESRRGHRCAKNTGREKATSPKRRVLSLPTSRREVPESSPPRKRRSRSTDPRHGRSS